MSLRPASILKKAFLMSGLDHLLRHIYAGKGAILCFHQVYPPEYRPELQKHISDSHFTPGGLETILDWFSRHGYTFASMDDIPGLLRGRNKRFVALTFDDGYRDNMIYAVPVLRKFDAPMTMYVSAGKPEDNVGLWIFLLDRVIAERSEISYGKTGEWTISCRTPRERKAAFARLLDYALFHPAGQRHALQGILAGAGLDIALYRDLMLTTDEWRELDRDPLVTIGAHGMTHSNFAALSDDDAFHEIAGSKRELEGVLGHPVRHFAYPYGGSKYAGDREFGLATEAGYATAVTMRHAHLFSAHSDCLTALPRINIGPSVMNYPAMIRLYAHGFTAMKANRGRRIVVT